MSDPQFHDQDLDAAKARADAIGGAVILSKAPQGVGVGFWSDNADTMIRTWESVEYRSPLAPPGITQESDDAWDDFTKKLVALGANAEQLADVAAGLLKAAEGMKAAAAETLESAAAVCLAERGALPEDFPRGKP